MKLGLEIHQRLDTRKLFCECKSEEAKGEPKRIVRVLHPVYSEMGEFDRAALDAAAREQVFEYLHYENCCCLVELDEEPPHPMNREALEIALGMAAQLHSVPVHEVHVMRKIVIDGSNTSGFQRTAVIATGGRVESEKGAVRISTLAVEEESAGIVEKKDGKAVYSLDRLGIPLIEIGTEPDIRDEEHLKEIAEKIGLMLRASGRVMRGLGTIRQDVNVSVEGGARVEIKGAQDLKMLPQLAENEARRQRELIVIIRELKSRFGGKWSIRPQTRDLGAVFANTGAKLFKAVQTGHKVLGARLDKHAGLLGREINPNRRYGTELSDYAKTAGVKGIVHSDESPEKYGISAGEWEGVKRALGAGTEDAFVMVVAEEKTANKAIEKVLERANMDYVPKETRKANEDGTSSYMRPIAGKARMYPETDIPPVRISRDLIEQAKGEGLEQKREKLAQMLNKEMAERMLKSRNLKLFEKLVEGGAEPGLTATTLEDTLTMLRREGIEPGQEQVEELFREYAKGTFVKAAIPDLLREMVKGPSAAEALKSRQLGKIGGEELKKIILENSKDQKAIMAKYRLRVDAREVSELIKQL